MKSKCGKKIIKNSKFPAIITIFLQINKKEIPCFSILISPKTIQFFKYPFC